MVLAPTALAGVLLSTAAALAFAAYFISIRLGMTEGRILDMLVVSLLTNVAIIVPIVAVVVGVPAIPLEAALAFLAVGVIGSFIARVVTFESVRRIGASRTSPIVAANVFVASFLAAILFEEVLTALHAVGIVLIVAGIAVVSWETARDGDPDASLGELGRALALPLLAATLIGLEPILVAYGLSAGGDVLTGVALSAVGGTASVGLYLGATGRLSRSLVRRSASTKWYVGAGAASTTGFLAYFSALEVAPVVIVVPLLQTTPLWVAAVSAVFLPSRLERVTWRLVAAAVVVVIGAAIVSVQ